MVYMCHFDFFKVQKYCQKLRIIKVHRLQKQDIDLN